MPNVLIVQERGRHKENVEFRESECLARAFRRIEGCNAEVWGLNQENNFDVNNPQSSYEAALSRNDFVLVLENYDQQGWLPDFSKTTKPKAFWSIDSHCALGKHVWFAKQSKFNIHFNSTPEYLKQFSPHSQKTLWLPNAFPADLFGFIVPLESHPVGFCGSMIADRAHWLDSVDKMIEPIKVKRDVFVLGKKMVAALHSYEISLNKSISIDINYRVFESMAAGALLLTNSDPPSLYNLFEPHKHILTYTSTHELADKIRWARRNSGMAKVIANAGHQEVFMKHSYDHRAKTILESFISL